MTGLISQSIYESFQAKGEKFYLFLILFFVVCALGYFETDSVKSIVIPFTLLLIILSWVVVADLYFMLAMKLEYHPPFVFILAGYVLLAVLCIYYLGCTGIFMSMIGVILAITYYLIAFLKSKLSI